MRYFHIAPLLVLITPATVLAEEGDFRRLYAERAEASSFLRSNWNKYEENYHPNYALDDNPKTAWVEGAAGNGEKEALTVYVSPMPSARRVKLRFRNGYQKSKRLFRANARPAKVRLALLRKDTPHSVFEATLTDTMGWQEVAWPVDKNAGFDAVRLTLVSTEKGKRYKDTCLSDLQIWVDSAVPYLADVEKAKATRLRAWIKSRVDKAAYFAKLPASYPLAHTEFVQVEALDVHGKEDDTKGPLVSAVMGLKKGERPDPVGKALSTKDLDDIATLLGRLRALEKTGPWHKLTSKTRFKAPVGLNWKLGMAWLGAWGMKALRRSDFSLFEVNGRWAYERMAGDTDENGHMFEALSNVHQAVTPRGLELALTWKRVFHERVITEVTRKMLLVYGKNDQLDRVLVVVENDDGMDWKQESVVLVDLTWVNHKVERFTLRRVSTGRELADQGYRVVNNAFSREIFEGLSLVAAK